MQTTPLSLSISAAEGLETVRPKPTRDDDFGVGTSADSRCSSVERLAICFSEYTAWLELTHPISAPIVAQCSCHGNSLFDSATAHGTVFL
jgi:hypothetical protein